MVSGSIVTGPIATGPSATGSMVTRPMVKGPVIKTPVVKGPPISVFCAKAGFIQAFGDKSGAVVSVYTEIPAAAIRQVAVSGTAQALGVIAVDVAITDADGFQAFVGQHPAIDIARPVVVVDRVDDGADDDGTCEEAQDIVGVGTGGPGADADPGKRDGQRTDQQRQAAGQAANRLRDGSGGARKGMFHGRTFRGQQW